MKLKHMTDKELAEFVAKYLVGQVFTGLQMRDEDLVPAKMMEVFTSLRDGELAKLSEDEIRNIAFLYEDMDKAVGVGSSGYPVFNSFQIFHEDDMANFQTLLQHASSFLERLGKAPASTSSPDGKAEDSKGL